MKKMHRRVVAIRNIFFCLVMITSNVHAVEKQTLLNNDKILIIYFSQPEKIDLQDTDGFSGASVLEKNNQVLGSTQYIAQIIHQQTHGKLFRIETVTAYPSLHTRLVEYARKEQRENGRPVLKEKLLNLTDYDTVFIGYPIWTYKMPMALYSFLEQHDLSGKTIIPFSTHGGSRFSGSISEIERLQPNANVIHQGITISRDDVADDDTVTDVIDWLNELSTIIKNG